MNKKLRVWKADQKTLLNMVWTIAVLAVGIVCMPTRASATILNVSDTNSGYGFSGTMNVGTSAAGGLSSVVTSFSITLDGTAYGSARGDVLDLSINAFSNGDALCLSGADAIVACPAMTTPYSYATALFGAAGDLSFDYSSGYADPWAIVWVPSSGDNTAYVCVSCGWTPSDMSVSVQATTVPEPSSLALLAAGLLGLAFVLLRRKLHTTGHV